MNEDDVVKNLIRYRRREFFKRVCKLPNISWLIKISLIAVIFLIISILFGDKKENFFSMLVSISCGCFTGMIFYFLVNVRNNKEHRLQKEYMVLKETFDILRHILNYGDHYKYKQIMKIKKRDVFEDGSEIFSLLYDLEYARNKIPLSVYDIVYDIGYDPIDRDNINNYRDKIDASDDEKSMEKTIKKICKELLPVADALDLCIKEREDQITFLSKFFL